MKFIKNGKIDIKDATAIQLYLAGKPQLYDVKLSLAYINGVRTILISDATEIQKCLVGFVAI